MDLTPYVDKLREELAVAAEAGGEEARALAERLTAPLDSAVRLAFLEALSAAADEITRELAPGSVDVRLRGRDPQFVVAVVPSGTTATPTPAPAEPAVDEALTAGAASARINLRLPDELKSRVEAAAASGHVSVNTWLVRAAAAALDADRHRPATSAPDGGAGQRFTGWVR
ncbi:toxin-antitoxin system HicB family antitoxin [Asanoa sp. WMMD1127]|uniref:toxin-antitoxin system HicB family antitoxin n=1 Tax=Asanoa sp. WMMD1127 TaxID=3016107 RepID=UPI002415E1EF|nr:toxin-antitoxin system HicB family antitoxin [Asanoa sp. WMMD1127]MDG4825829.1 toxin-antitoxin system HicB family antitoxin [Asanoa sp. WMMD1127]